MVIYLCIKSYFISLPLSHGFQGVQSCRAGSVPPPLEFPGDTEQSSTFLVLRAKDCPSILSTTGNLRHYLDPCGLEMLSQGLNMSS